MSEKLTEVLSEAMTPFELVTPPVAELIVRKCLSENHTLDEATMELRASSEVQSYRELLAEIEGALKRGRTGRLEAGKAIRALSNLALVWGESFDPSLNITRQKRTINFKHLPLIGKLLETANMSQVDLKDYILSSPPGYLAFISSWYEK